MRRCGAIGLLVGLGAVAGVAALWAPRIPQDPAYHRLADERPWLGIPNALNVLSNAGFVLGGALGLRVLLAAASGTWHDTRERWPYAVFFSGLLLTGVGSAYYHLAPGNERLFWDRLPLAVTLMGLLDAAISERIGPKVALAALAPLLTVGVGSVVYWHLTELGGAGDLRPYALVQFYPLVAVPLLLWLVPARYTRSGDLLAAAAIYGLAKLFELLDAQILAAGRIVSGHTLKHVTAALAGWWVLGMLRRRRFA